MKTPLNTRHANVTPFVLDGRWALDGLDRSTMRSLSKEAKRKHVGVADVIYEAVESFVAKCEAEAELENENYQVPTPLKDGMRRIADSSSRNAVSFSSARAQRNAFRRRDVLNNPDRSPARIYS